MATNIPPHNLGEVIDACVALIDNPALGIDDLINIIPGPDFPTGGIILGRQGIRAAYHLGRGSIVMRGKVTIDTIRKDREAIIISEIPYQVNKATMVERIAELVREKKIEGISDLRDESDRDGFRVVIELKRDAVPDVVLNQLYRFTPLQTNFGANMVALDAGRPQTDEPEGPADAVRRLPRTGGDAADQIPAQQGPRPRPHPGRSCDCGRQYRRDHPRDPDLARSQHRARNPDVARLAGQGRGGDDHADRRSAPPAAADGTARLSLEQAKAILDLRLQRLTALGREEISEELDKLAVEIADYLDILRSRARVQAIIKTELAEVKSEFATPRKTVIIEQEGEVEDEDLIQREDMVVTVSHAGYVKRVPLSTYRAQRRGGKGRSGMQTRDEDFVSRCSWPRPIRRCCSSRRAARSTRKRSGGCRWRRRTDAARP
jgi:DNA gyrase subunit A